MEFLGFLGGGAVFKAGKLLKTWPTDGVADYDLLRPSAKKLVWPKLIKIDQNKM